jgi:hypothetical protein
VPLNAPAQQDNCIELIKNKSCNIKNKREQNNLLAVKRLMIILSLQQNAKLSTKKKMNGNDRIG